MLVLGGREALITDAGVGALQVLTGPVGKAQAGVLAAFIYVCGQRGKQEELLQRNQPLLPGGCASRDSQVQNPSFHFDLKVHTTESPLGSVCARE